MPNAPRITTKLNPNADQATTAWTQEFANEVIRIAGRDGRVSRNEGTKADPIFRDNIENFFNSTGQKTVSVGRLIQAGFGYAKKSFDSVVAPDGRVHGANALMLPADLRADYFSVRPKTPAPIEDTEPPEPGSARAIFLERRDEIRAVFVEAIEHDFEAVRELIFAPEFYSVDYKAFRGAALEVLVDFRDGMTKEEKNAMIDMVKESCLETARTFDLKFDDSDHAYGPAEMSVRGGQTSFTTQFEYRDNALAEQYAMSLYCDVNLEADGSINVLISID